MSCASVLIPAYFNFVSSFTDHLCEPRLNLGACFAVPGLSGSGSGAYAPMPFDSVPQMQQQPGNRRILTSSQHSELEMARRRAEKAAEGKRANAEAAKQRFKRKKGERAEAARLEPEERQGNEEIEHKLSVVEDQKEAKRLKR